MRFFPDPSKRIFRALRINSKSEIRGPGPTLPYETFPLAGGARREDQSAVRDKTEQMPDHCGRRHISKVAILYGLSLSPHSSNLVALKMNLSSLNHSQPCPSSDPGCCRFLGVPFSFPRGGNAAILPPGTRGDPLIRHLLRTPSAQSSIVFHEWSRAYGSFAFPMTNTPVKSRRRDAPLGSWEINDYNTKRLWTCRRRGALNTVIGPRLPSMNCIITQIVPGNLITSPEDPCLRMFDAMSKTGPPGGSPLHFFPVLEHFASWFPGENHAVLYRLGGTTVQEFHNCSLRIVRQQKAGCRSPLFHDGHSDTLQEAGEAALSFILSYLEEMEEGRVKLIREVTSTYVNGGPVGKLKLQNHGAGDGWVPAIREFRFGFDGRFRDGPTA
ncbi:hypothetical protein DFH07DRAFT_938597 [Mycena maculata]|uniref:Uncharacterized protein n=1 Tax=Mycena maculata TaxID=230809 RepID=A0AAD7JKR0_9AGAR|nr:hypothetical protein DFH07DRAFT_938597 [Mycena maculata]